MTAKRNEVTKGYVNGTPCKNSYLTHVADLAKLV